MNTMDYTQIKIEKIIPFAANYGMSNGKVSIIASSGKQPYRVSIDGGLTFADFQREQNIEFLGIEGGTYYLVIKDMSGQETEVQDFEVNRIMSEMQVEYIANISAMYGNKSQAVSRTNDYISKNNLGEYITLTDVLRWERDNDFAEILSEAMNVGACKEGDILSSVALNLALGGLPIWGFVPVLDKETGAFETFTNKNNEVEIKTMRVKKGETLPNDKALLFILERKHPATYGKKDENGGNVNVQTVFSISAPDDYLPKSEG